MDELNLVQTRAFCILQLRKPVVDFPLDARKLRELLFDNGFLLPELLLDRLHIPVLQKIRDLGKRHVQRAQIAERVEHFKLARAVIAVAAVRVYVFRGKQAERFIVPQAADAHVKKPCDLADGKKLLLVHVTLQAPRALLFCAEPCRQSRR